MSFKREGNDSSLLSKLRKRRITELLSEDIPEDEAKLLCNGRFACTVCPSKPIFDTVNMLSVHRKGKKHLSNLEIHEEKKKELNRLIAARKHQQYLRDGTTSLQMAKSNDRGLLTSCPYDPRVKKANIKKGDRKPILDFDTKYRMSDTKYRMSASHPVATHNVSLPTTTLNVKDATCDSLALREVYEQCLSNPIKHSHQLKDIFKERVVEPVRVVPYISKFRKHHTTTQQKIQSSSHVAGVSSQISDQNHSQVIRTDYLSSSYGNNAPISLGNVSYQNNVSPTCTTNGSYSTQESSGQQHAFSVSKIVPFIPDIQSQRLFRAAVPSYLLPPPPPPSLTRTESCTLSASNLPSVPYKPLANSEISRRKEPSVMSQKLRNLQGSGWKRDWGGKWIKDELAEFDSDEEPPDIP